MTVSLKTLTASKIIDNMISYNSQSLPKECINHIDYLHFIKENGLVCCKNEDDRQIFMNVYKNNNKKENNKQFIIAANKGYFNIVKHLYKVCGCDYDAYDDEPINLASENGHLDIVKYIFKLYDEEDAKLLNISGYKYIDVIKFYCHECNLNPRKYNHYALQDASVDGTLEVVKYLCEEQNCDPHANNNKAMKNAARYNHDVNIVKYFHEVHGCDYSFSDDQEYFKNGERSDVIEYLKSIE